MNTKRCVRFARSLALGGVAVVAVTMGACGDQDSPPQDTTDVTDGDVELPDSVAEVVEEVSQSVDGPLAPPDMPALA